MKRRRKYAKEMYPPEELRSFKKIKKVMYAINNVGTPG
jgi:hypothetical protein